MNKRIERIVPEALSFYEAYLYLWSIWIEELNDWKYYGGWHAGQYHLTDYTDSSKDEEFRKDFATRKIIKLEILQYGTKNDMAYGERKMLAEADSGKGAKKSPNWYNKSNGGGKFANGWITNDPLDKLWTDYEAGKFPRNEYKKVKLAFIIENGYLIQTRNELFDTSHLKTISDGFAEDANPNEWEDIHVLMDAMPVVDKDGKVTGVEYCEGSVMIVGGNHRARGCVISQQGYALNAVEIPHESWKDLSYHQLRTLSNRLNPFDPKPSKSIDTDAGAEWVINECKEKNLYRKNEKLEKIIDYRHVSIISELKLIACPKMKQAEIFRKVQKLLENEKLQLNNDNLIDLSKEGLEADKNLKDWYDKKVKALSDEYDIVCKISGHKFSVETLIKTMRKNGWQKKICVLAYFHTKDFRDDGDWNTAEDEFKEVLEHVFSKDIKVSILKLPLTRAEARAEGYAY